MERNWRFSLTIVLLLLIGALITQWVNPCFVHDYPLGHVFSGITCPATRDVSAYFPAYVGASYVFEGEGMEFAAFTRKITYTSADLIQIEDLSGTNLVQIVKHNAHEVKIVWSQEEFYEKRSLLPAWETGSIPNAAGRGELTLLKAPIRAGTTWSDQSFQREIVAVDASIAVPLGLFEDVVVVKNQPLSTRGAVQYDYYAKNIGLIKRESIFEENGEEFSIVSALESFSLQS